MAHLKYGQHLAKGAFGDLYHGTYHGTEVAIKEIRDNVEAPQSFQEFLQVIAQSSSRGANCSEEFCVWVQPPSNMCGIGARQLCFVSGCES